MTAPTLAIATRGTLDTIDWLRFRRFRFRRVFLPLVIVARCYRQHDHSLRPLFAEPSIQLIGFVFAVSITTRVFTSWSFSCGVIVAMTTPPHPSPIPELSTKSCGFVSQIRPLHTCVFSWSLPGAATIALTGSTPPVTKPVKMELSEPESLRA